MPKFGGWRLLQLPLKVAVVAALVCLNDIPGNIYGYFVLAPHNDSPGLPRSVLLASAIVGYS